MKRALLHPDFRAQIRALGRPLRTEIGQAIEAVEKGFGQPHLHAGLGARKLSRLHYEMRVGLALRLIFMDQPDGLKFVFLGNHDQVRRFLKGVR